MQDKIERLDRNFLRFFLIFNLAWMGISTVSLIFSFIGAIADHPEYLHDWHGLVMFILALFVPTLFVVLMLVGRKNQGRRNWHWPPPLIFALPYWMSLYLVVTLLNLLDSSFVWSYFVVVGLTFSVFDRKAMLVMVAFIFLSYCYFLGVLTWPLTGDHLSTILGNGITFVSLTIICLTIQYLLGESHNRRALLEQLTQANTELGEAHRRIAENAAQEQELAVLRERTRLAREMHDTLGHALVLISVKLEAAQRLREHNPQRSDQELEATKEIVRTSMKDLRASIANLRSPALEREPACRALSRYAREMAQRNDLRVSYDLHPDIEGLPEPVEEALWKVGQEALANIEKHAQARNVLLHISRQDSQIFMKIEDDGVGMPMDLCQKHKENASSYASPEGHYGLNGMQERVKNMQGQFIIHPNNEHGTSIEVTLPLVEAPLLSA